MYLKAYANHFPWVKLWLLPACSLMAFLRYIQVFSYFKMKILCQVEHTLEKCWHKFGWNPLRNKWVIWHTSECTKREKHPGFTQAPASTRKSVQWNERNKQTNKKKQRARKNVIHGRKPFIRRTHTKNWGNNLNQLRVNDSWCIEGTNCLVNGWIGAKGMVFRAWVHERAPLNSQ